MNEVDERGRGIMQVEKRALELLRKMKSGQKPEQQSENLEQVGEALHFLDSNLLATGITVERTEEGEITGYAVDDTFAVTESGFEFLEKNASE